MNLFAKTQISTEKKNNTITLNPFPQVKMSHTWSPEEWHRWPTTPPREGAVGGSIGFRFQRRNVDIAGRRLRRDLHRQLEPAALFGSAS